MSKGIYLTAKQGFLNGTINMEAPDIHYFFCQYGPGIYTPDFTNHAVLGQIAATGALYYGPFPMLGGIDAANFGSSCQFDNAGVPDMFPGTITGVLVYQKVPDPNDPLNPLNPGDMATSRLIMYTDENPDGSQMAVEMDGVKTLTIVPNNGPEKVFRL